jgi:hypothetical protein
VFYHVDDATAVAIIFGVGKTAQAGWGYVLICGKLERLFARYPQYFINWDLVRSHSLRITGRCIGMELWSGLSKGRNSNPSHSSGFEIVLGVPKLFTFDVQSASHIPKIKALCT